MKNKQPKVLAVILARGGSKAIKKKNMADLNGHPLLAYTICEARLSKHITDIVVSSDDDTIIKTAKDYGALAPFKRPKELSGDKATSVECVLHATRLMEELRGYHYDFVVDLLCTNPFKTSFDIDSALDFDMAQFINEK